MEYLIYFPFSIFEKLFKYISVFVAFAIASLSATIIILFSSIKVIYSGADIGLIIWVAPAVAVPATSLLLLLFLSALLVIVVVAILLLTLLLLLLAIFTIAPAISPFGLSSDPAGIGSGVGEVSIFVLLSILFISFAVPKVCTTYIVLWPLKIPSLVAIPISLNLLFKRLALCVGDFIHASATSFDWVKSIARFSPAYKKS